MCNRLDQHDLSDFVSDFAWADEVYRRSSAELRYNVALTTNRPTLRVAAGALILEDRHWGYKPSWADEKAKEYFNARREKVLNGYWGRLIKRGRIIVPANGWYEWTGEKNAKQPWHIHRADNKLLYIAAIASLSSSEEVSAATGFALVTADAEGGMVDVHDRRPVVFDAATAALWMDEGTTPEMAEQLCRTSSLGPDQFQWFKVSKAVGNVRNQGAELAAEQT